MEQPINLSQEHYVTPKGQAEGSNHPGIDIQWEYTRLAGELAWFHTKDEYKHGNDDDSQG